MAAAAAYVADYLYYYVATYIGDSVALYYASYAVAYATEAVVLNAAAQATMKRGKTGETRGMEVSITDSTADSRVIYGEIRLGGVNIIPPYSSGTNGQYLHQVLALCTHEIDSFQKFYMDQEELTTPAAITGTDNDGKISTSGTYKDAMWVRGYTGTMTQNVDYILHAAFPTQWPTTSRGRGWAYVAIRYDYGSGKVYRGIPPATFKVRGSKVYDPRLDSTNGGSGSQRYTDPTTWTYSSNPALCWANYRTSANGSGLDPATEIVWSTVAAAADICDALVDNKDGGTRKRYTCNGLLINSTENLEDNAHKIIDAMYGRETYIDGKYSCYAGGWTAPAWTIEKTDWLSISNIQTVAGRDAGRVNSVHSFYVDPNRNWQRVECYPRRNTTYQSDDAGESIEIEMEQPMCTDESEAQMKAEFRLRSSRNGVKLAGTLPPRFMKMRTYDVVAVNFAELGWVSKTFRISAMQLHTNGMVGVALVEEQSTDWTDLAAADYGALSTATVPAANPTTPGLPSALTITKTTVAGTLLVTIGEPVVVPVNTRYQLYRSAVSTGPPSSGELVYDGDVLKTNFFATDGDFYYFARAYSGNNFGSFFPGSVGVFNSTPRRVYASVSVQSASFGTGLNQVLSVNTYQADADGLLSLYASADGWATYDEDSGTYTGLVCAPSSMIADAGFGLEVSSVAAPAVKFGSYVGFRSNSGSYIHGTSSLLFTVTSGQVYAFGWYGKHAFGSQVLRNAVVEHQFLRDTTL